MPASTIIPIRMAKPVAIRTAPSIESSRVFTCATMSDTRIALTIGRSGVSCRSKRGGRRLRAGRDRGHQRVGRRLQRARREDDREIEAHAAPVDLAQRCDPRLDRPAEHGDGQRVADLQAECRGGIQVDADQRRAAIVCRPPIAGDDAVGGRQGRRAKVRPRSPRRIHAPSGMSFMSATRNAIDARSPVRGATEPAAARRRAIRTWRAPGSAASSARGISTRNRAGACLGTLVSISARMLDAVPDKVTSSVRPSPSDTASRPSPRPGRSSAAMPSRVIGPPRCCAARASRRMAMPISANRPQSAAMARDADRREARIAGADDGQRRRQRRAPRPARRSVASAGGSPSPTSPRSKPRRPRVAGVGDHAASSRQS